ncbi:hypothetical protein CYJ75_03555 [Kocuria rhizophila]|nr:hypothetical protein CYJ75_03555 [Kocuria rhizophila]
MAGIFLSRFDHKRLHTQISCFRVERVPPEGSGPPPGGEKGAGAGVGNRRGEMGREPGLGPGGEEDERLAQQCVGRSFSFPGCPPPGPPALRHPPGHPSCRPWTPARGCRDDRARAHGAGARRATVTIASQVLLLQTPRRRVEVLAIAGDPSER